MTEQIACKTSDLAPGTALRVDVKRADGVAHPVAIVRSADGEFYAIDDTCSHADVSLSEGDIEGCEIECWAHGSRFDIRTGHPDVLPAMDPIRTYPVRVDGDAIWLDVDAPILSTKENA